MSAASHKALLDELGLVTREAWQAVRGGSLRTLKRDEVLRRGPVPVRLGKTGCYYKKSDIAAWIEAQQEAQRKPTTRKRGRAGTGRFAARGRR